MVLVITSPVQRHVINFFKSCDGSGHDNLDTKFSGDASELKNQKFGDNELLNYLLFFGNLGSLHVTIIKNSQTKYSIYPWVGRCSTAPHTLTLGAKYYAGAKTFIHKGVSSKLLHFCAAIVSTKDCWLELPNEGLSFDVLLAHIYRLFYKFHSCE